MTVGHWLAAALVSVLALVATRADAAGSRRRAKSVASQAPAADLVERLSVELSSEDEEIAQAAAAKLGGLRAPQASRPLIEALAAGLAPTVAVAALAGLGKLGDPRALGVLALYAGNLNVPVRTAAVKALGDLREAGAAELLLGRLGDSEASVRAAAAEALAARRETRAEKRLFALVARNDAGAAGPLGKLMAPDAVPRLAELRGRVDDDVLATALGELLKRPDVPDRLRLDVVSTLGRIPGAAVTTALVEYLASIPDSEQRPSKEEAQKLLDQRGDK